MGTLVISANNAVVTQSFLFSVIFSENAVNFQMTNCILTENDSNPGITMGGENSGVFKK